MILICSDNSLPLPEASGVLDIRPKSESRTLRRLGSHHSPPTPLLASGLHLPHWLPHSCTSGKTLSHRYVVDITSQNPF